MSVAIISDRKIQANRQNSLKSTGPVTPEGKAKSSRNAITHGIFAADLLLPGEDRDAFNHLRIGLIQSLNPANAMELQFVEQVIEASWKLNRVRAAEKEAYARQFRQDERAGEEYLRKTARKLRRRIRSAEEDLDDPWKIKKHSPQRVRQLKDQIQRAQQKLKDNEKSIARPSVGEVLLDLIKCYDSGQQAELERLSRYESQLLNMRQRAMNQLRELRRHREENEATELSKELVEGGETEQQTPGQNEPTAGATDEGKSRVEQELGSDSASGQADGDTESFEDALQDGNGQPMGSAGLRFMGG